MSRIAVRGFASSADVGHDGASRSRSAHAAQRVSKGALLPDDTVVVIVRDNSHSQRDAPQQETGFPRGLIDPCNDYGVANNGLKRVQRKLQNHVWWNRNERARFNAKLFFATLDRTASDLVAREYRLPRHLLPKNARLGHLRTRRRYSWEVESLSAKVAEPDKFCCSGVPFRQGMSLRLEPHFKFVIGAENSEDLRLPLGVCVGKRRGSIHNLP
jgi:hypothetical protein